MPSDPLQPVSAPAAFRKIAAKVNAHSRLLKKMRGEKGVSVTVTPGGIVVRGEPATATTGTTASSSGTGLPAGYTFEQFTICDSGSPATRWWPTWTSDPS